MVKVIDLPDLDKRLVYLALDSKSYSYSPYSKFAVGCSLSHTDPSQRDYCFQGANVENKSFPLSLCAERSAISYMLVNGFRKWQTMALVGSGDDFCLPCGGCLQVLQEHVEGIGRILLVHPVTHMVKEVTLRDLYPNPFKYRSEG